MIKVNLGKPTATIHPNMNRKKVVVDSKSAESLIKSMGKDLDSLNHSFEQMGTILNKASYKKMFLDDYNSVALQCSQKCSSMFQSGTSLKTQLENRYNDDVKTVLIENLDERISYLESKILSK